MTASPFRNDVAAALERERRLSAENEDLRLRVDFAEAAMHIPHAATPLWYVAILVMCVVVIAVALHRLPPAQSATVSASTCEID